MNKEYWEKFYAQNSGPFEPSSFAKFGLKYIPHESTILDVACGNGRDSIFFAEKGFKVLACDQSNVAINFLRTKYPKNPSFFTTDISDLKELKGKTNVVYARFLLHAISKAELLVLIKNIYAILPEGGSFMSESRSDKTDINEIGKHFEPHFRRLVNSEELMTALSNEKFHIDFFKEDNGLAIYKEEDPIIIRLVVSK